MVSKMDRSELEDKFIRMYEENLIIKRYAKKQDEKIRKLVEFCVYRELFCVCLENSIMLLQGTSNNEWRQDGYAHEEACFKLAHCVPPHRLSSDVYQSVAVAHVIDETQRMHKRVLDYDNQTFINSLYPAAAAAATAATAAFL